MCVPVIYKDSQYALYLCKDLVTNHIEVKHYFIRDLVDNKDIEIKKILGEVNPADFGTKIVTTYKSGALHIDEVGCGVEEPNKIW